MKKHREAIYIYPYKLVLLEALPPVCMKYTAQDESGVANITLGKTECYICHKTHQVLYTLIQAKWQCFKCFF